MCEDGIVWLHEPRFVELVWVHVQEKWLLGAVGRRDLTNRAAQCADASRLDRFVEELRRVDPMRRVAADERFVRKRLHRREGDDWLVHDTEVAAGEHSWKAFHAADAGNARPTFLGGFQPVSEVRHSCPNTVSLQYHDQGLVSPFGDS